MRILSIGVITCNRPEGLRLLLASLARQTISEANAADFSWYVHVTDNDLSGENPKVIAALRTQFPAFDVRLSDEPVRGIPAARNRSVIETHDADALIFVDDDDVARDVRRCHYRSCRCCAAGGRSRLGQGQRRF